MIVMIILYRGFCFISVVHLKMVEYVPVLISGHLIVNRTQSHHAEKRCSASSLPVKTSLLVGHVTTRLSAFPNRCNPKFTNGKEFGQKVQQHSAFSIQQSAAAVFFPT